MERSVGVTRTDDAVTIVVGRKKIVLSLKEASALRRELLAVGELICKTETTRERVSEAKRLRELGLTTKQIAARLDVSVGLVAFYLGGVRTGNRPKHPPKLDSRPDQLAQLRDLAALGLTAREISERMGGIPVDSIYIAMRKHQMARRGRGAPRKEQSDVSAGASAA
jgi:predicted transcriptional regulator